MSKYWILDREESPQGFPLAQLIAKIREVACASGCRFFIRRCQGYGSTIAAWDGLLDRVDELAVEPDELERLSAGAQEWFYNLEVRCVTPRETIAFGVHDSTALFLEASSGLVNRIAVAFKVVRIA